MADERRRGSWHSADGQARVEGLGGVGDEIYAPVRIGSECLTDELPADATMSVSGGEEQLGEVTGHAVAESMAATSSGRSVAVTGASTGSQVSRCWQLAELISRSDRERRWYLEAAHGSLLW